MCSDYSFCVFVGCVHIKLYPWGIALGIQRRTLIFTLCISLFELLLVGFLLIKK